MDDGHGRGRRSPHCSRIYREAWLTAHLEVWSMVQWRLGKDNIDEQYLAFIKTEGNA